MTAVGRTEATEPATAMTTIRELLVSKQDLRVARIRQAQPTPPASGNARLRLDLFGLTSNNITYAAMGVGSLGYWDFFPGTDDWGRPPCWGFGTVVQSSADGVDVGARYYGYFPIADVLDVTPQRAGPRGFVDGSPHRSSKAAVYNQYLNAATDPAYDAAFEAEQVLFRPLYATGWWAADCVMAGAPHAVVVSSASSKTALSMVHQLRRTGEAELVALTSARNQAYVRETGLYDRAVTYEAVDTLTAPPTTTYVDFLGREDVIAAVHRALGVNLARSILIGATDWDDKPGGVQAPRRELAGPTPELFFVPTYAADRLKAQPELGKAMVQDMRAFYPASRTFVTSCRASGGEAVLDGWQRLATGEVSPRDGLVLSL
jgi:Protein of unknown function (DUF2855)